ncbi:MAG: response regulator [Gammaproteobacteria bacterium]|jgi:signal transduction histidine kinase|nr:response regulator [Gammaproteobacteria bacterium]MBT3846004.1 response regulator [Gammaproteobacteria bacterium]MBT4548844.1 response regulator [Gammaproteobacteria bacterium]MBT5687632.1 response regulator [Gammaproteobacteria bacterium]MBT7327915.1 response regulator [Gammaproteobacteria bacterium]
MKKREKSIKSHLFMSVFLVLFITTLLVGWVTFYLSVQSLESAAIDALQYQAEFRKTRIQQLFDEQKQWMVEISNGIGFQHGIKKIARNYQVHGAESKVYQFEATQFRDSYQSVLSLQGVDDLFLVTKDGELAFSLQEKMDSEVGLLLTEEGFYGKSILSELLKQVLDAEEFSVSKYGYLDLLEMSTVLMAIPIAVEGVASSGEMEAVLVRPFSLERLDDLLNDSLGLGNSGDIVVAQKRVLGNGAVFIGGHRKTDLSRQTQTCRALIISYPERFPMLQALNRKAGSGKVLNSICIPIYAVWDWLPDLEWAVVVRQDQEEILATVAEVRNQLLTIFPFVLIGLFFLTKRISMVLVNPLMQLTQHIKAGSKEQFTNTRVEEINELSNALYQKEQSLIKATQSKDEFLASMSHELRTPLSSIIGNSELIAEKTDNPEIEELIRSVEVAGRGQLALVNDILDMSKIESGKFTVEEQPYSLTRLLQDIEQMFSVPVKDAGLELVVEQQNHEEYMLIGDVQRIRQILINLTGNAIKFTEIGTIEFRTERWKDHLLFTVKDSGIGMSPGVQEKLFSRFEQADGSISRRFGGSGLGLYISLNLAEMMGGTIDASSREGEGSIFQLILPYQRSELKEKRAYDRGEKFSAIDEKFSGKVLIAEDTPELQLLERRILENMGLDVTTANDGKVAVQLATGQAFDVIFMDMQMPVMDGIEATKVLRSEDNQTPIVALTANVMEKHREQFTEAGCDAFLGKPIDKQELRRVLKKFLG